MKVSLILLLQLGICVNVNAQGRFVTKGVAVTAGAGVFKAGDVSGLGSGVGLFADVVEIGIHGSKLSSNLGDDYLTAYAGYIIGYVIRPNGGQRASVAVGPFYESVSNGRRSVAVAGLQLYGSQQLYSSEVLTISPEIGVLAGVGVENYDEPIFTGASIALSFAFGTA
ncbi:MAG: hypothetical protein IH855_12430 [Bacteroidetes bacterium]|nr:hypothetical protein [Bacteroidota bacterium]